MTLPEIMEQKTTISSFARQQGIDEDKINVFNFSGAVGYYNEKSERVYNSQYQQLEERLRTTIHPDCPYLEN